MLINTIKTFDSFTTGTNFWMKFLIWRTMCFPNIFRSNEFRTLPLCKIKPKIVKNFSRPSLGGCPRTQYQLCDSIRHRLRSPYLIFCTILAQQKLNLYQCLRNEQCILQLIQKLLKQFEETCHRIFIITGPSLTTRTKFSIFFLCVFKYAQRN